jgi:hypothetical protein
MKKIFYILSICVMTILQPSCDALDLAPEDYYGAGNFWKEASQPKAFMLGLHAQLRSYYDMFYTLGELRGGMEEGKGEITGWETVESGDASAEM